MRNFRNINKYLDSLALDIYPQPPDDGHTAWATEAIDAFFPYLPNCKTVLDVGCGQGFCQSIFEKYGFEYTGIAMGEDVVEAKKIGKNVIEMDFSFLEWFENASYDVVFSRHSLEHAPSPLLTLMEWHRVTKKYLVLVLPAPEYWQYAGRNHYFMLHEKQWENLFDVAGFTVVYKKHKRQTMGQEGFPVSLIEYWYLLKKKGK
jgi:SAM-dependent methyltransferase